MRGSTGWPECSKPVKTRASSPDASSFSPAKTSARPIQGHVGLPEAQLALAQAVVHLARTPKSNAVATAIWRARDDVRSGRVGEVPPHLRDAHYRGAASIGHGVGYVYPHEASTEQAAAQQYLPVGMSDLVYYVHPEEGDEVP
jgi:putative ATPase